MKMNKNLKKLEGVLIFPSYGAIFSDIALEPSDFPEEKMSFQC